MCRFHKDIGIAIANDPTTQTRDPGPEMVIRIALSRYWLEDYVRGGEDINGFNPYPMATSEQQRIFAATPLEKDLAKIAADQEAGIALLRHHLLKLGQEQDLSPAALNLPIATAREAYLDMAIDKFYVPSPQGGREFIRSMDDPQLAPLHRAVGYFQNNQDLQPLIENLVKGRISQLYIEAPTIVNQKLIRLYDSLPQRAKDMLTTLGKYGGNLVMGGFSGLVGHGVHYGSVLGAGLASGMASSTNYGLSGLFLVASYGGWDRLFGGRYRSTAERGTAFALQAALTATVALSTNFYMAHNHLGDAAAIANMSAAERDPLLQEALRRYNNLPEALRVRLDKQAAEAGLAPELYLGVCSGRDTLGKEIMEFEQAQRAQTNRNMVSTVKLANP